MGPKPILKASQSPQASIPPPNSREERNRELALHHATLIQHQKDVQSEVFESLLELLDLPAGENADPAKPSALDVESFKQNLKLFQSSDFDSLIEERHANGKCGYALCPRPFKKQSTTAKFRIVGKTSAADMKIVPTASLEQWCSEACAKRAMYVKVQLSDEPPWLRAAHPDIAIMPENTQALPVRLKSDQDNASATALDQGMEHLRLERGDNDNSSRPQQVMSEAVLEKASLNPAIAPRSGLLDSQDAVEGYVPKGLKKTSSESDSEEDEDEDRDWGF